MNLLKLVIVDDEAILLKGLAETFDWASMGFQVVGTALSGEQAMDVIEETKPDVVLTDIRMKQMTGLQLMEEVKAKGNDCLFIVLSAYRDFSYAKQACDLGAIAYLLKPIEEEQLQEVMSNTYKLCMEQQAMIKKVENLEKLVKTDSTSLLQVVVQKYLQNQISFDKMQEIFDTVDPIDEKEDRFVTVEADIDLAYQITNSPEYEAARLTLDKFLEAEIGRYYFYWHFKKETGALVYVVRTTDNLTVREMKHLLERARKEQKSPIVASISKPYKGLAGILRSYEEADALFTSSQENVTESQLVMEKGKDTAEADNSDEELPIYSALRKNDGTQLKEAFVRFLYTLPKEEDVQRHKLHGVMLQAEILVKESYGMTEELRKQFAGYYSNMQKLSASKLVDVCYKILQKAVQERSAYAESHAVWGKTDYMEEALAYIEEHLSEEDLSIVSVAAHVYLNPVYFGRVFKEKVDMSFKKYLLRLRMERAKKLIQNGADNMGSICDQIGIGNPSYFAHLFKEYTGKLPSEYKKEFGA